MGEDAIEAGWPWAQILSSALTADGSTVRSAAIASRFVQLERCLTEPIVTVSHPWEHGAMTIFLRHVPGWAVSIGFRQQRSSWT